MSFKKEKDKTRIVFKRLEDKILSSANFQRQEDYETLYTIDAMLKLKLAKFYLFDDEIRNLQKLLDSCFNTQERKAEIFSYVAEDKKQEAIEYLKTL